MIEKHGPFPLDFLNIDGTIVPQIIMAEYEYEIPPCGHPFWDEGDKIVMPIGKRVVGL